MSFWIKGSSSDHKDFSNDLAAILAGNSVATAAVNAGGTSYVVGDILTVAGGTATIAAQIEVTSVSGGVIDGVRIFNAGSYTADPTTTANAVTGGSGSSATIDLTVSGLGWTVDRDQVWDGGTEREVIAHGEGGGADAIYVGWRTFSNIGSDFYNWELHGLTGYSAGLDMSEQPGVSPGDHEAGNPSDIGSYMILSQNTFNWWLNINSYRIIMTASVGSSYFHAYLGWGNRIGTSSEYPYPMLISGPSELHDVNATSVNKMSSITDPWITTSTTEPAGTFLYQPGGGWLLCANRRGSGSYDDCCVTPTQRPQVAYSTPSEEQDRFMDLSPNREFNDIIFSIASGTGGTTVANLRTTGSDHLMLPCYIVQSVSVVSILMEIDECKWCNNFGGVSSEDRFIESDGTAWRVFQNGNRTDTYAYIAIKESN